MIVPSYMPLLDRIAEISKRWEGTLQPRCVLEEIGLLRDRSLRKLSQPIPDEYAAFLAITDGLDFNGLTIYASRRTPIVGYMDRYIEGLVEGNLAYRGFEPMADYLIFTDDGTALYVLDCRSRTYQSILRVGLSVMDKFDGFDSMLCNALMSVLASNSDQ